MGDGGWLYALELAPAGHVKVGKTGRLSKRLSAHLSAAAFGGGGVVRVYSAVCEDMEQAEGALLDAMHARPDAVLVHGRETFAGVPFLTVAGLVDEVAAAGQAPRAVRPLRYDDGGLLESCLELLDVAGAKRLALAQLCAGLEAAHPDVYAGVTPDDLGRALRSACVTPSPIWCPASRKTCKGVKREWLEAARAA